MLLLLLLLFRERSVGLLLLLLLLLLHSLHDHGTLVGPILGLELAIVAGLAPTLGLDLKEGRVRISLSTLVIRSHLVLGGLDGGQGDLREAGHGHRHAPDEDEEDESENQSDVADEQDA